MRKLIRHSSSHFGKALATVALGLPGGGNVSDRLPFTPRPSTPLHPHLCSTKLIGSGARAPALFKMSKKTDKYFEAGFEAGSKQGLPSWIRKDRHGLRIKLVFSGSEMDKDGYISEHTLRTAFADLLMAEDQAYGKGVRPWRKWEGCTTFGDILVRSVAKVAEDGLLHVEEEKRTAGGRRRKKKK